MSPGSDGAYYFLNDSIETSRETIPPVCAGDSGTDRKYNIPLNSTGEILAFIWEGCDSIPQYALSTDVYGQGSTSPAKGIYSQGVQVTVTAAPALGWAFNGWLGDTISSANPLLITMKSNFNIAANFIKLSEVPVTFKVDMTGVDATNGVYVTGEFPNQGGKTWQLNKMIYTGNNVYQYKTNISISSAGPYYFLNDDKWGVRESVPSECAVYFGSDRGFNIPVNSTGETYAFVWSSCEEIGTSGSFSPIEQKEQISRIYPNPVTDSRFFISIQDFHGLVTVSVIDFQGRLFYSEILGIIDTPDKIIEIPVLATGVYLIRIYSEKLNVDEYHKLLICN